MTRRALIVLLAAAALCAPASQALASGPSVLVGTPSTTADRFRPTVTFTYTGAVTVVDADVDFHKKGSTAQVPFTVSGSGSSVISVSATGTLASGATYDLTITPAGDASADSVEWKT